MKRILSVLLFATMALFTYADTFATPIDMQAHVGSDEGRQAYNTYVSKQNSYYTNNYSYDNISVTTGDALFGLLNTLMGNTCKLAGSSWTYNSLRNNYVKVDKDLNLSANIIGYYDGRSMNGTWDSGKTWNREHTWPQSKGADSGIPMGYDMQSVRPASTAVNSDRGNTPYGESSSFYDPNVIAINNTKYKDINLGSYRGDAARVILYDYLVYGKVGSYKNAMYNGNAQLLDKLGKNGVFENVAIILKWHMQDPPSLTEMVRNDGAQTYQGNRNPFIDFPEIAVEILGDKVSIYNVTIGNGLQMWPAYRHTPTTGFISYLTLEDGTHPKADKLTVTGTDNYTYDETLGRLIVSKTYKALTIELTGTETPVDYTAAEHKDAPFYDILGRRVSHMQHGQIYIREGKKFMY